MNLQTFRHHLDLGLPIILTEKPRHCDERRRHRGERYGDGCRLITLPTEGGSGDCPFLRKFFEFSISKWCILADSEVLNLVLRMAPQTHWLLGMDSGILVGPSCPEPVGYLTPTFGQLSNTADELEP
jgi:hypothetical protein